MRREGKDNMVHRERGSGAFLAVLSMVFTLMALVTPWPTVCLTVALLPAACSFIAAALALSYVGVAGSILAAFLYVLGAALSPFFHW